MKFADSWHWPDVERHLLDWLANPKARMVLNGRPAYQGKKQIAALDAAGTRRGTMIDVGGHVGLWSFNFAHWFKKIEAFEPVAAHRECFQKNVLDDPKLAAKVTLHPYAMGDTEKMVSIHTNASSTGDSWVDTKQLSGKANVEMKTLDSFDFQDVDLIKIDVEGYEEFVLRGAEQTIRKWKPAIIVEQKRTMSQERFNCKPLSALHFLYSLNLGYKTVAELSGDYVLKAAA